jgi:DNA polymerase I-like protein with 3'-5' exonuclease and polymerase domains
MVYFDTSAAEVRAIAYKSGDPNMIKLFESGADFYGSTAAVFLKMSIAEMKEKDLYSRWRSKSS